MELDFIIEQDTPAPGGSGISISAPLQTNVFTHVAATYSFNTNTASGLMSIYMNGLLTAQTNTTIQPLGDLVASESPALGIGDVYGNPALPGGNFTAPFYGLIDEITLYGTALSGADVDDIYAAGSAGKDPVGLAPPVTATVIIGPQTNIISGTYKWTTNVYSFTAPSNSLTITIFGNLNDDGFGNLVVDGMLLDSFTLVANADANPSNYFLPEESLDKVIGENALGNWTLEVLDNRAGATNPAPTLVSWELSLVFANQQPAAIPLTHAIPVTNSVGPNSIAYFYVDVPPWAIFATNILSASGPVNLLFNQAIVPTGTNTTDYHLLTGVTTGTSLLTTNGSPPLVPGQRYYLGVQNTSTNATVAFTIEVDFNITTLFNAVPVTSTIAAGNIPQYFQFDVGSNEVTTFFQILSSSGNVELVASQGPPLPTTANFSYVSAVFGTNTQTLTVTTNSTPTPLAPGRWYLGVYNNDVTNVTYTIMATEVGLPTIIALANDQRFTTNFPPGLGANTFFSFTITNTNSAALFELYQLNGNVDLTLNRGLNNFPYSPPFFAESVNPGTNNEQIVIRTNQSQFTGTNLNNIYYLGVPNNETTNVTFTIHAVVATNGMLISAIPINVGVSLSTNGLTFTWPTVSGETYQVQDTTDLGANPIVWNVLATVSNAPPELGSFVDTNSLSSPPYLFFRIIQVPTP